MKALFYVISLLLSLPNLLAGMALMILRHTFATRQPLQIITDFLFQIVWGLPLAASLFVVLLVLGSILVTRPYAAMFAFVLNTAALVFVLSQLGVPSELDEAIFFSPILLALIGFGWVAGPVFLRRGAETPES
jgi:hypothetical protein